MEVRAQVSQEGGTKGNNWIERRDGHIRRQRKEVFSRGEAHLKVKHKKGFSFPVLYLQYRIHQALQLPRTLTQPPKYSATTTTTKTYLSLTT